MFGSLLPATLVTKNTLHTQLTTVQPKLEQPPNGQGMEIGEKEKIYQRQPINYHLSLFFLLNWGKGTFPSECRNAVGPFIHSCQVFSEEGWKMLMTGNKVESLKFINLDIWKKKYLYARIMKKIFVSI